MRTYFILWILLLPLMAFSNTSDANVRALQMKANKAVGHDKIDAQNELCEALIENNQLKDASALINSIKNSLDNDNYPTGLAAFQDNEGYLFMQKYDYSNAMQRFVSAWKIRSKSNDEADIALSRANIGYVYLKEGDWENAIDNLNESLKPREKMGDFEGASKSHKLLGDAYLAKKLYGKAKDHYKRSLDLKIKVEDFEGAAYIASYMGTIVKDLGDYEGALVYHHMSLDLNRSTEDMPDIAKDYNNIALTYQAQNQLDEALEANNVALDIRKELGDKLGLAETYKNIGMVYVLKENKTKALKYLDKSAAMLTEIGTQPETYTIYKSIAAGYEKIKEHKKAYHYHMAFANAKDEFHTQEKGKDMMMLTTRFKSELAAEEQATRIDKLEMEKSAASKFRLFLMALLGALGLLAFNLFASNRRKKRDNELLTNKNEEINRQKSEIDDKNIELNLKNESLDVLNTKLVDEMAERESIEKSSFQRDHFLATMSHEMRTPMNAITGLTHILISEKPRTDQMEHLRNLQFSANNLTVFINDILDFSKIEAGKLSIESRTFQPQKLFKGIQDRFKTPIEEKNIRFNYSFDERIPEQLIGDPGRLDQIMNNLLLNGLERTERGNINMEIYLDEYNTQEAILKIKVIDSGKGLSKSMLDKMFKKFDASNMDEFFDSYERSGLSLATAKRLVELQNGKIEVDTAHDKGTVFTLFIPCKRASIDAPVAVTPVASTETKASSLDGNKILIVEDNRINQLVVAKLLKRHGVEVVTADNGQEAIEEMRKSDFDLVLMDIQMPIMDGYKATTEIRNMAEDSKRNTPIIALTASAFLSETEKARLFGMNDHVAKPFSQEDLLEKITACLATSSSTRKSVV